MKRALATVLATLALAGCGGQDHEPPPRVLPTLCDSVLTLPGNERLPNVVYVPC